MKKELVVDAPAHFEGFDYPATTLNKFILTSGIFTMMVKGSDKIVSYSPDDTDAFLDWLVSNDVADIRKTG